MNNLSVRVALDLGVPYSVAAYPHKLRPIDHLAPIEMPNGSRTKIVSEKQQAKWLDESMRRPLRPYVHVMTGQDSDYLARLAAYAVFEKAYSKCLPGEAQPLWYTVLGGHDCVLRDSRRDLSLLVLSNVTINSTPTKLEKVRDLLNTYDDVPRILVAAGASPMQLRDRSLFCRMNRMAYFA